MFLHFSEFLPVKFVELGGAAGLGGVEFVQRGDDAGAQDFLAKVTLVQLGFQHRELAPDRVELFRDLARYFKKLVEYPAEVIEQMADEQYVRNVVEILFRASV